MATAIRQAASWYPGSCSITFTHSEEPLILPGKSGPKRAFSELCKDVVGPCNLNPFLFNGHLQTAWTAMKVKGPPVHYKRRVFESTEEPFAGHFAVDFVVPTPDGEAAENKGLYEDPMGIGHTRLPPRTTYFTDTEFENLASNDNKPLLITLHGLSGGSYEVYLRHALALLSSVTPEGKTGGVSGGDWECLVVNSRGCAGSKITTSMLYNARATWDIRQVVKWARKQWPNRPIFGIGYSLGANILTNYVAEESNACELSAAVAVSNPFNLELSSKALQRSYIGLNVYSKTMGTSMRALYNTHKEVLSKNKAIDQDRVQKAKYLHEWDREVQCATWGYLTEDAYYRDASSSDSVLGIRIPFLALHATDDPIAVDEAVPYKEFQQNPYTVICATSGGGHLSWFEWGGGRWHAKPIVAFLNAMWREVAFDKMEPAPVRLIGPWRGHRTPFTVDPLCRKPFVANVDA